MPRWDQFAESEGLYYPCARHNTMLADLLTGVLGNHHSTPTHREIRSCSNYGVKFIELMEGEISEILSNSIPLWREYSASELSFEFESPYSLLLRVTEMYQGINQSVLELSNGSDLDLNKPALPIHSMNWVLDMTHFQKHDYMDFEFDILNKNGVTWLYLLDEVIRVCGEDDVGVVARSVDMSEFMQYVLSRIDIAELRLRQQLSSQASHAQTILQFDVLINAVADLIAPIIVMNYGLIKHLKDMMINIASQQGRHPNYYFNASSFNWLNTAFVINVGVYSHDVRYAT